MRPADSIEAIYRRISRVYSTTRQPALLYVAASGEWWVGRQDTARDRARCKKLEDAGLFVGAYLSTIEMNRLSDDVEGHISELRGMRD